MARGRKKGARSGVRRSPRRWLMRGIALTLLFALAFAAWLWWDMRTWRPDEALYPEQGALLPASAAPVRFETLKAIGAQFVYLSLTPEPQFNGGMTFSQRVASAQAAGLKVGVLLNVDPCAPADEQSGAFAQMVPRDADLLPPALGLNRLADSCDPKVSDAAVESELMTLINQIEMHSGKPVILKLRRAFQSRHNTATALSRDLWLMRDRARPDYAGRPWLLWTANSALVTEASEEPIEWVVVQK